MKEGKQKSIISLSLFLISFAVYLKTLCPTITFADSGELITASYILGIPHPPGSPLYCLLGRLFTFLPFCSIAYRVNLMSAFFASLTIVLVYLIILKILTNGPTGQRVNKSTGKPANRQTGGPFTSHIPPIVASLCFAFSKSFWSYTLVSEVYTLKAFFLALLIFILLKWKESLPTPNSPSPRSSGRTPHSTRYLYLFALIYGLSFSNYITMVLLFPAFLYFVLLTDWRAVLNPKNIILVIMLFAVGLSLYLYLPIRSLQNPALDWGDPENLKNFVWMVTGKQYHFRLFKLPLTQLPQQLKEYFLNFREEFTWLPLLVGIIGLGCLGKKRWSLLSFFLLILLTDSIFNLCQAIIEAPAHFFLSSYFIFSLGIGYGLKNIVDISSSHFKSKRRGIYLISFLLLFLSIAPCIAHYQEVDRSGYYLAYDWGRNILNSLEKDALVIGGESFIFWYFQYVEGRRPDVIHFSPLLLSHEYPWYLRQVRDRYPQLIVVPREMKEGREFSYPITEEMKKDDEAQGMAFPSAHTIRRAIIRYLTSENIERRPVYLATLDRLSLPPGCHQVFKGFYYFYRVERGKPKIVIRKTPKMQKKVDVSLSPSLRLLGYNISSQSIKQGGMFEITYYWKILRKLSPPNPKILTHFTPEKERFEADSRVWDLSQYQFLAEGLSEFYEHHPLAYGFALECPMGQVISEEYGVMVPSDLSPGTYYINVGMIEGKEKRFITLGQIEVKER